MLELKLAHIWQILAHVAGGEVADLPGGIERVISRSDLISSGYRFSMEIIQTSVVSTGSRKISPGSFA